MIPTGNIKTVDEALTSMRRGVPLRQLKAVDGSREWWELGRQEVGWNIVDALKLSGELTLTERSAEQAVFERKGAAK